MTKLISSSRKDTYRIPSFPCPQSLRLDNHLGSPADTGSHRSTHVIYVDDSLSEKTYNNSSECPLRYDPCIETSKNRFDPPTVVQLSSKNSYVSPTAPQMTSKNSLPRPSTNVASELLPPRTGLKCSSKYAKVASDRLPTECPSTDVTATMPSATVEARGKDGSGGNEGSDNKMCLHEDLRKHRRRRRFAYELYDF